MEQQELQRRIREMPVLVPEKMFQHEVRMDREYLYAAKSGRYWMLKLVQQRIASQDVIWAEQFYHDDAEGSGFSLRLYTVDGKFLDLSGTDNVDVYNLVLVLKDNIPHLLYGSHPEYERMFRKDPRTLMAYAKSR